MLIPYLLLPTEVLHGAYHDTTAPFTLSFLEVAPFEWGRSCVDSEGQKQNADDDDDGCDEGASAHLEDLS